MKINMTFNVTLRCRVFEGNTYDSLDTNAPKEDIIVTFNESQASNICFRNGTLKSIVDGYRLSIINDTYGRFETIILNKDNRTYIVLNPNQVINDLIEGLMRVNHLTRYANMLEFDFETALNANDDDVEDEF